MARRRNSDAFESIKRGLEEAIACQQGKPPAGTRAHRFERLPDGTIRHTVEVIGTSDPG